MKENEAPERIYCESDGLGNIVKVHNIKWPDDEAENIEYASTDAFIEKASCWIEENIQKWYENINIHGFRGMTPLMIIEFKKYMKGE